MAVLTLMERRSPIERAGFKPTPVTRRLAGGSPAIHVALVNGSRAVLAVVDDRVVGAVAFDVSHGEVASLRGIADTLGTPNMTGDKANVTAFVERRFLDGSLLVAPARNRTARCTTPARSTMSAGARTRPTRSAAG